MSGTTPYMIRAIHEWCSNEGLTPYMLIDATVEGVVVPMSLVADGTIVMNLDYNAVDHLEMENEWVLFSARFNGKSQDINIPVEAVRAIYAKENGQGCLFPEVDTAATSSTTMLTSADRAEPKTNNKKGAKPNLVSAPNKATGARKLQSVTKKSKPPKKQKEHGKPALKLVD